MLRLRKLTVGDIIFQWKYGFYYIYVVILILYMCIISMLRGSVRNTVCDLLIYSDPAAMGMFFMGAIVLLEKSQRVMNSLAVSPVKPMEYIIGKMISIGFISVIVGGILMLLRENENVGLSLLGICLASFLFTLLGLIVGTKISSLNQYVLGTVPFEIIGFVPAIAYRLGWQEGNQLMLLHPGCALMELIRGNSSNLLLSLLSIITWLIVIFFITNSSVTKMFRSVGGVKL